MDYFLGAVFGAGLIIVLATIYSAGAKASCEEVAHVKCDVKWIAISEGGE